MTAAGGHILYGRHGSGSIAVQIALEEIGIPYHCVWVAADAEAVESFRSINPTGKVPALGLPDGTVMFESAAILVHLSLAHPAAALAPATGGADHARFLQWMTFLSANVYDAVLRAYYSDRYSTRGARDADSIRDQAARDLLGHLRVIGRVLNPYVLGSTYSIADPYLHMLASWYPAGRQTLAAELPALALHGNAMVQRPAVAKVEAEHAAA